jgi:hypothetical protein
MNQYRTLTRLFLIALAMTSALSVSTARAEQILKRKVVTSTTTTEINDPDSESDKTITPDTAPDLEMTASFGSTATSGLSGCKTDDLSKNMVKELKSDCNAWLKDQKTDLKTKYRVGACEEKCSVCQPGLQRCNVVGKVHYAR